MPVLVNLFADFVDIVRKQFNLDKSIDSLEVVKLFAWSELRTIPQKKWVVHYSEELTNSDFYMRNQLYIDKIKEKAEKGEKLSTHASVLISDITGKDDMLADWGIYHLHIGHGNKVAKITGFVNRGKELLFVIPSDDNLYFIQVLDHNSWTSFELIETIDKNWPFLLEAYKLKGVAKLAYEPTEKELYKLRKSQLNSSFRIGASFFMGAGGGIASDGSSVKAVQMAQNLKKILDDYSIQLRNEELELSEVLRQAIGKEPPLEINLKLMSFSPQEGSGTMIEGNTQVILPF